MQRYHCSNDAKDVFLVDSIQWKAAPCTITRTKLTAHSKLKKRSIVYAIRIRKQYRYKTYEIFLLQFRVRRRERERE